MRSQTFEIQGLNVQLDLPAGRHYAACALFVHFFPPQSPAADAISLSLTQQGLAVLRLALAEQQDPAHPDMLVQAYQWLEKEKDTPALFVGHSLAGAIGLKLIEERMSGFQAVALIGAPGKEKDLHPVLDEDMLEEEVADINLSSSFAAEVDPVLLDELFGDVIPEAAEKLNRALLLLHSPQDKAVSIDAAARLYVAARHPKSYLSLDGADHLLSKIPDARYAGNLIAHWASRYIDLRDLEELRTHMEVVTRTPAEGFTTEIRAGNHSLIADEPESVGGANLGPTPYDFLTAALGTCTSMTLQMYARRKKWPLEEAIVHLKHDKVYAEDCASCPDKAAKLDELTREIELIGPLDEEQKARLMEIADKCPVHRTLEGDIQVKTRELKKESSGEQN